MVKTFRHFYILVDNSNIRSMSSGDVFVKYNIQIRLVVKTFVQTIVLN